MHLLKSMFDLIVSQDNLSVKLWKWGSIDNGHMGYSLPFHYFTIIACSCPDNQLVIAQLFLKLVLIPGLPRFVGTPTTPGWWLIWIGWKVTAFQDMIYQRESKHMMILTGSTR